MEKVTHKGKIIEVVQKEVEQGGKTITFEFARRSPGVHLIIPKGDKIFNPSPLLKGEGVRRTSEAAYEGVSHLLRLDYHRIAMIGGPATISTSVRRLAGYREALEACNLKYDPALYYEGDFRVNSGYSGGVALLKQKPDAVFISNYLMAVGFIKAQRQYQLRCPQDIAIVTCDDHPWMDSFSPRLTTLNFPKYELGSESTRVLIERLANRKRPVQRVQLKSSLCIRESCGYSLRAVAV